MDRVTLLFRPLLVSGMVAGGEGERFYIIVDSEQPADERARALWHETLHLLMLMAGIPAPHDEAQLEAWAAKLAAACPELLAVLEHGPGGSKTAAAP